MYSLLLLIGCLDRYSLATLFFVRPVYIMGYILTIVWLVIGIVVSLQYKTESTKILFFNYFIWIILFEFS